MASDRAYDSVVVFAGIVAAAMAGVYWAMRLGFADPIAAIAKPLVLAWFFLCFPAAVRWLLAHRGTNVDPPGGWPSSYAFLSLLGLALSAFLGWLVPIIKLNVYPLIALIGVVAFGAVFIRWVTAAKFWRSAVVLILGAAFGVWAGGVVWGRIYKNPLFLENLILDGRVHHDTLHLAAFANMLRTYHIASTGIDGIPYVPYHWGTQWLFSQWSNLTGSRVIDFYQLGFPVTMIPYFFAGVLALAVGLRIRRVGHVSDVFRSDLGIWVVFLAACIGVIPLASLDALGVWTSNYLISESYTVAVPVALMVMATTVAFFDQSAQPPGVDSHPRLNQHGWAFYCAFLPLAIVALGYLKISLMLLALPVVLYLFVRLRAWSQRPAAISAILLIVGCYLAYRQVSLPAHHEGFARFDFMKTYVPFSWWPFFFLVHLAWTWLYIAFRFQQMGVKTLADLSARFQERSLLDVEAVVVVALLGIAPGLLLHIDGGSAFYFSDVQRWVALALILSFGPEFIGFLGFRRAERTTRAPRARSWRDLNTTTVLKWLVVAPLLVTMLINATVWPARMARANGETRRGLYSLVTSGELPAGIHAWLSLRDPATIARGMAAAPNYGVTAGLESLGSLDLSARRRMALFIPQTEIAYWHSLTRPGACTYQSFVAPAITAIAMIDGMPEYGCPLSRYYGLGAFAARQRPQTAEDRRPSVLCARARRWGLSDVLVATFDSSNRLHRSLIRCL
jgi:hypothetical protein